MKKFFLILILFYANNISAQTAEYEEAISLLEEQLQNPDLTPEMRTALEDVIAESQSILIEVQNEGQGIIYSEDELIINNETAAENERRNNLQGLVSPTPLTTSNSSTGRTLISGNAN